MTEPNDGQREKPTKRRAQMSCDRCKTRKTKCVDPVPGPCNFCASIGATCHVDVTRRRQRPYYQVSEEEFRYMTKALEHFMPDTALNLANLREFVQGLGDGPSGTDKEKDGGQSRRESITSVSAEPAHATPASNGASIHSASGSTSGWAHVGDYSLEEPIRDVDEVFNIADWLVPDQFGIDRFVGPQSSCAFQDIVTKHLQPNATAAAFPVAPLSSTPLCRRDSAQVPGTQIFLPRRDLFFRCLARYFQDIHSVYWLFHPETLTGIGNRLYAGDSRAASSGTICCLYCIIALTGESEAKRCGEEVEVPDDPSAKYLVLAKGMVAELYDRADIDSVRALCLLALLHHPSAPHQAYIYIGAAARIAYSLTLPIKRETSTAPILTRQLGLRIFCTLYLLDLDISQVTGYPPALTIHDAISRELHLPTEQFLCAGSYIPPCYQAAASDLSQITRQILQNGYPLPNSLSLRPSLSVILDNISALHAWRDSLPLPFRNPETILDCHARAISVLHLRFYTALILATRPFLLYVLDYDTAEISATARRKTIQDLSTICIDAADRSLSLLHTMAQRALLSSLLALDVSANVENAQIFLLVVVLHANKNPDTAALYAQRARDCLNILHSMETTPSVDGAIRTVVGQLRLRGISEESMIAGGDGCVGHVADAGAAFDELFGGLNMPMGFFVGQAGGPAGGLYGSQQRKAGPLAFPGSLEEGMEDLHKVIFQEIN